MQNYHLIYKAISIVCHVNGGTFQLHTMLMRNCTQNNTETQSADYFIQEQKDSLCIIQWGENRQPAIFQHLQRFFHHITKPSQQTVKGKERGRERN